MSTMKAHTATFTPPRHPIALRFTPLGLIGVVAAVVAVTAAPALLGRDTVAQQLEACSTALNEARYDDADGACSRAADRAAAEAPISMTQATSLRLLARYRADMGWYAQAEVPARQALELSEALRGATHPDTAAAQLQLAVVYESTGRAGEAEELRLRAIGTLQAIDSAEEATADALAGLAMLYVDQHRYAEAQMVFERALAIIERMERDREAAGLRAQVQRAREHTTDANAKPVPLDRNPP